MAKIKKRYVCQNCGYVSPKWLGKCAECGEWNTMVEELEMPKNRSKALPSRERGVFNKPKRLAEIDDEQIKRYPVGNEEFARVLGGGLVPGGVVLLGGDPGIGKSTILLQLAEAMGSQGQKVLYISGEESEQQLKMRAVRMHVMSDHVLFLSEINVPYIRETIIEMSPDLVIIDSIQTMYSPEITSAPGSVSQIRENANSLIQIAKKDGISMVFVGHVTKEGSLAGPRILEHMVDTVLYFEGEKYQSYRMLRAVKNRFGSTNELGIFEMTGQGLASVKNPSKMMLLSRPENTCGSAVVPCMEGSRPLLIELQGLVTPSGFSNPRRMAKGLDYNRVVLLIAIMEKRLGIDMQKADAYVNVIGGMKIDEPAVDLAVAAVLFSSFKDFEIAKDLMLFGEVGLTGEVRTVQNADRRLSEGKKLGFKKCILPKGNMPKKEPENIQLFPVDNIAKAFHILTAFN